MNTNERVGLIGVGLLGTAIATRLIENGMPVLGFDLDATRLRAQNVTGLQPAESSGQVFRECHTILLSLPTSTVVRSLLEQSREQLQAGSIVIDTTTGDPEEMIAIARELRTSGVEYAEATVAASSVQVAAGQATLFIGCGAEVVEKVQLSLAPIASRRFFLGDVGTASRFKLVHNLLLGLHRAVLAEGLAFSKALGFDEATTLDILKQTPARSEVMETKGRKMVEADYSVQARLSQHLKDVRLILSQAGRAGQITPLSDVHRMLLEEVERLGLGDADNSAVIEAYRSSQAGEPGA